MFFGKRQPVGLMAPAGAAMMTDAAYPQAVAYAGPVPGPAPFLHAGPVAPGYEVGAYAAPGMAETVHAVRTEAGMPCGPTHYEHSEFDVDIHPAIQPHIHVVRKGETVYKIAKMHGLDWRELAGYNHLGNPNLIYPGQRLFIPPRF